MSASLNKTFLSLSLSCCFHIDIRDSVATSALDLFRVKVGVPYNDLKHCISQYNSLIGMVRLRTIFILSSRFWEIGRPPTGGAGGMKLSCVVPA